MAQALLIKPATAIIGIVVNDLAERSGFTPFRNRLRGMSEVESGLHKALVAAHDEFAIDHSDLVASLFDQQFLSKDTVTVEIAKLLTPNLSPSEYELAKEFVGYFPHTRTSPEQFRDAIFDFLVILDGEIRKRPELVAFVNSRNINDLAVNLNEAVPKLQQQVELQEKIVELLEDIREHLFRQNKVAGLEFILDLNRNEFNAVNFATLLATLVNMDVKYIRIVDVKSGSVIVKVEMPPEIIDRIILLLKNSPELVEQLKIRSVRKLVKENQESKVDDLASRLTQLGKLELSELANQLSSTLDIGQEAILFDDAGTNQSENDISQRQAGFDVVLQSVGPKKINVIKAIRGLTSLGLREAQAILEESPSTILEQVDGHVAEEARRTLQEAGAEVDVSGRHE